MVETSQTIVRPNLGHYLLILFLAVVWGSAFVAIKISVVDYGPYWTMAGRVSIAFLALLPWALYRGWVWPKGWFQWSLVLTVSLLGNALPFGLISWALQEIEAGLGALLTATSPFFALTLAHLSTRDDRFTWAKLFGIIMGFVGLFIALSPDLNQSATDRLWAAAAVVLAAFCYASSGTVLRYIKDIPTTRLSALTLGLASPGAILFAWLLEGMPNFNGFNDPLIALIYLGLIPTAGATLLRYYLIPKIGVSFFSQTVNLVPIFALIIGAMILGESLTWTLLGGLAFVLLGLAVSGLSMPKK